MTYSSFTNKATGNPYIDPATGKPYANSTVHAQGWGNFTPPAGSGQTFASASDSVQSAIDSILAGNSPRYAYTQTSKRPEFKAASDLAVTFAQQGGDFQGIDMDSIGDGLNFWAGDDMASLQAAKRFFDSAAGGYGGNSAGGYGGGFGSSGGGFGSGSGSAGGNGMYSIGGVSAVNPQAGQANELDAFKRYEDAAFANASGRLNPFIEQQKAQFAQQMANQGIPAGSDAYNKALAQMNRSQSDAMSGAAFDSMGFGLQAQNQSFGQDHARSQLANALMQAQMQKDVGMANVNLGYGRLSQDGRQFDQGLAEKARQFNDALSYDYDTFYDTLGQRNYEFDSTQDYNYWDRGNFYDIANRGMDTDDYRWAYESGPSGQQRYADAYIMALLGGAPPGVAILDPNNAYNTQITGANANQANLMNFLTSSITAAKPGGF